MRTLLAVLLCVAVIGGCSGGGDDGDRAKTPPSAPAKPDEATIAWMDGICAVEAAHLENPEPPQLPPHPDEFDRPIVIGYISTAWERFRTARSTLDRLGSAPVPEGEQLVEAQHQGLVDMLDTLAGHLNTALKAPTPNLAAPLRLTAMELAGHSFDGPRLVELIERYPTLAEAHELAPQC